MKIKYAHLHNWLTHKVNEVQAVCCPVYCVLMLAMVVGVHSCHKIAVGPCNLLSAKLAPKLQGFNEGSETILKSSLNITLPTNALSVCHLF